MSRPVFLSANILQQISDCADMNAKILNTSGKLVKCDQTHEHEAQPNHSLRYTRGNKVFCETAPESCNEKDKNETRTVGRRTVGRRRG